MRNDGQAVTDLRFVVIPRSSGVSVTVVGGGATVPGFMVKQFKLKVTATDPKKTFAGTLVAAAGSTAPGVVKLEVGPKEKAPDWLGWLVFLPLPVGAGVVGLAYLTADKHGCTWTSRLGPANWDFSKSWASNITVVGALLGTILAAGVLPDEPAVSKATYEGLNLYFGVLILVAPLVYTATQKAVPVHKRTAIKEAQYQGSVRAFVLASGLTLGAVLGELATIFFLFREIRTANSMPEAAIWFLAFLLVCSGVLLLLYAWRTMQAVLDSQCKHPARRRSKHRELQALGTATMANGQQITEQEVEPELPELSLL